MAETLILLISELVTNAVVHTGCPAVLRMLLPGVPADAPGPGTVRVEVVDRSARPPAQRHAEGDDTNGRGLELVDGLADRWGWQPEGAGKSIWCEVDRCESGVVAVEFEGTTHDGKAYDEACAPIAHGPAHGPAHDYLTYGPTACDATPHGVTACDGAAYGRAAYGRAAYDRVAYDRAARDRVAFGDVDIAYETV